MRKGVLPYVLLKYYQKDPLFIIMTLDDFVQGFAELFDETDPLEIQPTTIFHDLDEWSSLTGMAVLAYVKSVSGQTISPGELRECITVEDVFKLLPNK